MTGPNMVMVHDCSMVIDESDVAMMAEVVVVIANTETDSCVAPAAPNAVEVIG